MSASLRRVAVLAVAIAATATSLTAATSQAAPLPHVNLSFSNPDVKFTDPTHWTIPIRSSEGPDGAKDTGGCEGTYLSPEIVAAGKGTAVYYGTKYSCTEPVEYTVQAGVYFVVNPEEQVDAGSTTRSGVSQNPFVDGLSVPCVNNNNGGWVPYDFSQIHGIPHSGTGTQTTVGCQINH